MATVFDATARDWEGPAQPSDIHFDYLNRSCRPEAERVRQLIDRWIAAYPTEHRKSLVQRLRSNINNQHLSAFFELFLHALLLSRACRVLAIEPSLPNSSRSPDFLVEAPEGQRFYLEAVLATEETPKESGARARLNKALEAIDSTDAPFHFLDVEYDGVPKHPITLRRLKHQLAGWIARLPRNGEIHVEAPFRYEEHGLSFTIGALLRNAPANHPGGAIGIQSGESYVGTPGDGIREVVAQKASRYGTLDLPLLVAVNALGVYQQEEDAVDALFGAPRLVAYHHADGLIEHRERRGFDGVWRSRGGPRKTGLSAIISTERLSPWSLAQCRARLIRNPWAARPLGDLRLGIDELRFGEALPRTRHAGQPIGPLLGLSSQWPLSDDEPV
jgi:hypothetical protein